MSEVYSDTLLRELFPTLQDRKYRLIIENRDCYKGYWGDRVNYGLRFSISWFKWIDVIYDEGCSTVRYRLVFPFSFIPTTEGLVPDELKIPFIDMIAVEEKKYKERLKLKCDEKAKVERQKAKIDAQKAIKCAKKISSREPFDY